MFTLTFLKVSKISFSCSSFLDFANLLGKGEGVIYEGKDGFGITFFCGLLGCEDDAIVLSSL